MWSPRHLSLWLCLVLVLVLTSCAVDARSRRELWGDEDPDDDNVQDLEDYGSDDHDGDGAGGGDLNQVENAKTSVQLTQYDYSDDCGAIADARWRWLLAGEPGSGPEESQLWRNEAALGASARDNVGFVKVFADLQERVSAAPAEVVEEVGYALHAGDLLLPEAAFAQKLNYSRAVQRALSDLRVPCHADGAAGGDADCVMTLPVVRRVLARSGDASQQLRAWRGAQAALLPLSTGFPAQLQLARAAAAANEEASEFDTEAEVETDEEGAGAVGTYWVRLQDPDEYLEMTYMRARQMWEQVRPLHRLVVAFVRMRLKAAYGEAALAVQGAPAAADAPLLPAHLTGSLVGDDWSALADLVYPNERLRNLDHALGKKGLKGKALYSAALETLNASLGIEDLPHDALIARLRFDGECPSRVVPNCSIGGAPRVLSCSHSGWMEYAEAHEILTRLAHVQFGAEEDKKTLLRITTRYSATHDMLPAIVRLLSLHPDRLEELDVLPDEANYDEIGEEKKEAEVEEEEESDDGVLRGEATLRLLTALRVLPRLAYYAAADAFRLRLLAALSNATALHDASPSPATPAPDATVDPVALWAQVRREYMLVAAPAGEAQGDAGWLADPAMAANVPLLGRFFAELLAFQALEYLASYDPHHPLSATRDDARIPLIMKLGHSKRWPELLNDQLDINELRAEPLLRYFSPLKPLLSAAAAAKASPAAKREAVDLTPPVLPPTGPPSSMNPFLLPFDDPVPTAPASSPAEPSAPGSTADATANTEEEAKPSYGPTSDTHPVRASVGGTDNATAHTAVLATSLAIFGAALAAGAVVGGRRLLKKRSYPRNRRPDAPVNANKITTVDVEASIPEEAVPVNVAANET